MKPEPLKDKGNTVNQITDWVINLYDKQAEELRKQGINATLDMSKVLELKNTVYKEFKEKKIFDDEDILSAVEWLNKRINHTFPEHNVTLKSMIDKAFQDVIKK